MSIASNKQEQVDAQKNGERRKSVGIAANEMENEKTKQSEKDSYRKILEKATN